MSSTTAECCDPRHVAAWRDRDSSGVAFDQDDTHLPLEELDLLGQRRLRDVQPCCRAAEVELLGQHHEGEQQPQVDTGLDTGLDLPPVAVTDIHRHTGESTTVDKRR